MYQETFLEEHTQYPEAIYEILQELFTDAEEHYDNPELRAQRAGLDDLQLIAAAQKAKGRLRDSLDRR